MSDVETAEPPGEFKLPQSAERTRWQISVIGWSHQEIARRLRIKPTRVSAWSLGKSNIPPQVALWLETIARLLMNLDAPIGWVYSPSIGESHHAGETPERDGFAPQDFMRVADEHDD